jgi:hypothetical protein
MSKGNSAGSTNEGIQGSVTAEVVAVGRGARATKVVNSEQSEATDKAVAELRAAIEKLTISPDLSREVSKSLHAIDTEARKDRADAGHVKSHLGAILGALKTAGVVAADIAAIAGPIKTIATLFGITLPLL